MRVGYVRVSTVGQNTARQEVLMEELGAERVYLYISHCENSILDGELLQGDLVEKVYTTNSIFTKSHEKVQIVV